MNTYFSRAGVRAALPLVAVSFALAGCSNSTGSTSNPSTANHSMSSTDHDMSAMDSNADMAGMAGMDHGATTSPAPHADNHAAPDSTGDHAMAGMHMASGAVHGDGTSATEDGFTLKVVNATRVSSDTTPIEFTISGATGEPVVDFAVEQTKKLHLIVVRRDLTGFQHLHPAMDAAGMWSTPATLTSGSWRVIADFTPIVGSKAGARLVLGADLTVDGTAATNDVPPASATSTVDGYTVTVNSPLVGAGQESTLTFAVYRGDQPVTDLVPYLGAFGHLVALRADDLGYLHVHPTSEATTATGGPNLRFQAMFEQPGTHRLYLQFQTGSTVHTAEFSLDVS